MYLKRCWAPCFTLNQRNSIDLEPACIIIAIYTGVLHVLTGFYGIYVLDGGRTDTFYSPIFEFSKSTTNGLSIFILIYSILYIICCSIGLIYGVRSETRFYYIPFLWTTLLELLCMISFGLFMIYRYWHYGWAFFATITLWFYSAYHFYLFWTVVSQYYYLKDLQEPTFIILYP